jgi:hypothetical protein
VAKIIKFPRPDAGLDEIIPPKRLLEYAIEDDVLDACIIIGVTKDDQPYFSSTTGDVGHALYYLERAKRYLLEVVEETRRK